MSSCVAIARTLLCATLLLATACCPDARPPRKTARAGSEDSISVLAAALARAIDRGNGPAATEERESAAPETRAADRQSTSGGKKSGSRAPAAEDGPRDEHVPKPKFTREMLEKAIDNATKAITPENADEQLESLRKELESGTGTGETGEEVDGDDGTADDVPETEEDQSTDGGQPSGGD